MKTSRIDYVKNLLTNNTMDGLLFDIEQFTESNVLRCLQGRTCRQCGHRAAVHQGEDQHTTVYVCSVRKSGRTKSGYLRVRVDQPACFLFSHKDNSQ